MGTRNGSATVVGPGEVDAAPVKRARGARMAVLLGPEQGTPNFITRRFLLSPGAYIPRHRHATIEHEQVMVRGEMVIELDVSRRTVRPGDAIYLPAGAHAYTNRGTAEVEFLCVGPVSADYATEWLEEPPDGAVPA
jgi:quercetin dioxygenase-like cupin family protein